MVLEAFVCAVWETEGRDAEEKVDIVSVDAGWKVILRVYAVEPVVEFGWKLPDLVFGVFGHGVVARALSGREVRSEVIVEI